mmetsp:Transcript_24276/g.84326  ORF Transcript_24276/g.84326 Transcript_24276/m.84326 type:complete len:89 (-) Transcript_24276:163-429(-)
MFARCDVNGAGALPLYKWLKDRLPEGKKGADVRHNFAKFLVDRDGQPVKRYDPSVKPLDIEADIVALLEAAGNAKGAAPAKRARASKK